MPGSNTDVLDKLIRMFKTSLPVARVGVLGKTNARRGTETNAEIGAKHEFGTTTIPRRSFLAIPITEHFKEYIQKAGLKAFNEDTTKDLVATGKFTRYLKILGTIGEQIVQDAFSSGGFGKWAAWKPGYTSQTGDILVDSTQLKKSITSDVVTKNQR